MSKRKNKYEDDEDEDIFSSIILGTIRNFDQFNDNSNNSSNDFKNEDEEQDEFNPNKKQKLNQEYIGNNNYDNTDEEIFVNTENTKPFRILINGQEQTVTNQTDIDLLNFIYQAKFPTKAINVENEINFRSYNLAELLVDIKTMDNYIYESFIRFFDMDINITPKEYKQFCISFGFGKPDETMIKIQDTFYLFFTVEFRLIEWEVSILDLMILDENFQANHKSRYDMYISNMPTYYSTVDYLETRLKERYNSVEEHEDVLQENLKAYEIFKEKMFKNAKKSYF